MKITLDISPAELKEILGADKLEKAFYEQMPTVTGVWSQVWLDWMKEHMQEGGK
jgi:hypothetical protein